MSGVYNRKLFRKASARDELRRMGGIMASSEDLLREALKSAEAASRTSAPPAPAMPMQQMAMPMQPMMPMAMPMQPAPPPMPMQPMQQPPMQQPPAELMMQPAPTSAPPPAYMPPTEFGAPYMPPQVPPSAAFNDGGVVESEQGNVPTRNTATEQASAAGARVGGGFLPPGAVPGGYGGVPLPESLRNTPIDVTQPAGTVVAPVDPKEAAAISEKARVLAETIDDRDPEEVANEILSDAAELGAELSGDRQTDLANILNNMTGDVNAYEMNIDALNRGIIGAAIAAGTSPRATENIAKGMLVGLEAARQTEERRVGDARALQLAELQARAAAARGGGGGGSGAREYRNPVDAYQDTVKSVMSASEVDMPTPPGMTREEYADQVALSLVARSYTQDQLVGTPFEGISRGSGQTPAPTAPASAEEQAAVLDQARAAIEEGRDPAMIADRLRAMGIDPGLL